MQQLKGFCVHCPDSSSSSPPAPTYPASQPPIHPSMQIELGDTVALKSRPPWEKGEQENGEWIAGTGTGSSCDRYGDKCLRIGREG